MYCGASTAKNVAWPHGFSFGQERQPNQGQKFDSGSDQYQIRNGYEDKTDSDRSFLARYISPYHSNASNAPAMCILVNQGGAVASKEQ